MKKFILFALCSFFCFVANAQDKKEYLYEIESFEGRVAAEGGTCLVKVWNYGKREKFTRKHCMEMAIHGILFKGYAAANNLSADKGRKALVPEGYASHKDYFDKFFSSGEYLQYVQLTNNGAIDARDLIKISKREYKIGMVVLISYDALRKRLENDNIIKRLDYLF
jgi:hypothetical protein